MYHNHGNLGHHHRLHEHWRYPGRYIGDHPKAIQDEHKRHVLKKRAELIKRERVKALASLPLKEWGEIDMNILNTFYNTGVDNQ